MKAPRSGYVVDGQVYEKGEEVWDLGNWKHNSNTESKYDYTGNEEVSKLPPYAPSGATAYNPVTGVAYMAYADPTDSSITSWAEI